MSEAVQEIRGSCEGTVTEREYLGRLQSVCWYGVTLDILSNQGGTSPVQVLERIRNYGKTLSPGDELWCVVDKDQWTSGQFDALLRWKAEPSPIYRGIALSNPKFELWLLAHFRDLPTTCGPSECERLLVEFLPDGGKHIIQMRLNFETTASGRQVKCAAGVGGDGGRIGWERVVSALSTFAPSKYT